MNQMRNVLRLCRARSVFSNKRYNHVRSTNGNQTKQKIDQEDREDFQTLLQKYKDKITFSSYLDHEKLDMGYFKYYLKSIQTAKKAQRKAHLEKSLPPLPVSLQYYVDKDRLLKEEEPEVTIEPEKAFQLPFAKPTKIEINNESTQAFTQPVNSDDEDSKPEFDRSNIKNWMVNYEQFDDSTLSDSEDTETIDGEWSQYYGKPDPNVAVSSVPCGGCGALLHCSDPAIPGYLPSEIYKGQNVVDLKKLECQRCHFLKEYNIALDVTVQPEEYEKLLQAISHIKSLVLLMVDLLDFPCSIWPGIVDIIGTDRPIIVVGNKVDLLPGDSIGYMKRIKESLMVEIGKTKLAEANIRHISLISAKTGYGVEDLISAMFKYWMGKGDVFLVGCTNVGKSSLFNSLLQSDYCKVHAVDIVKRATVSRWPGTTLNLLKFPINRPSGWKIYQRTKRLKAERILNKIEKETRRAQLQGRTPTENITLMGHIGRTFSNPKDHHDVFSGQVKPGLSVLDERDEVFQKSRWFYDTPGVIHPDQTLSLLSTEELLLTVPKKVIRPQTYYLRQGDSFFIGGLGRIDVVGCPEPCRFTIFCSESLPITVTKTEDADEMYNKFVGTELFAVPSGGAERMRNWPGLKKSDSIFQFHGEGPKTCCGDVVLSSFAWMSVTAKKGSVCKVAAWTPEARGVHQREPSVLPYAVNLKGKRVRETPAYMIGNVFSEND